MHDACREHEVVLAAVMADRADWERATRHQRQMAVAADAELRRRHPEQPWPPLRSAEPQLETDHANAVLTPGEEMKKTGRWIRDLAAQHREFADRLAERQSVMMPAEHSDFEDAGLAFPTWTAPERDAILLPPKPQITPSERILERQSGRDLDMEAAD